MSIEITTHHVNDLNKAISIQAVGEPGPGGDYKGYVLRLMPPGFNGGVAGKVEIYFQDGNPADEMTGFTNEALLAVLRHRLECLQAGKFACPTNGQALDFIILASRALESRTLERASRAVEGTHNV